MSKASMGQFFTTNSNFILSGFENLIKNKNIYDPFAGGGDLLNWAQKHQAKSVQGSDIDKKLIKNNITFNDSLKNIPYADFILTNPPYLGKNKMSKNQKSKYMENNLYEDFYLLAIDNIIESKSKEGILIVPVNFLSAENSQALRTKFLNSYQITKMKYFKFQVFEDTTYNVIAFHYIFDETIKQKIPLDIYIDQNSVPISTNLVLEKKYNYQIAGKEINKIFKSSSIKINRTTEKTIDKFKGSIDVPIMYNDKKTIKYYKLNSNGISRLSNNIILLNCIDTNCSVDGWINAEDVRVYNKIGLVGKNTSRNIAHVILPSEVSIQQQEQIIVLFNKKLNYLREKYHSLFLTNFRDNDRKRISFDFCYKLISHCYEEILTISSFI